MLSCIRYTAQQQSASGQSSEKYFANRRKNYQPIVGFLFKTLCIRDLRVFADALNGTVYHYRDKSGLECDAVVHLRNGSYGLIEIKLGGDRLIEEGASNLTALCRKLDTDKMKKPSFLMVLTGTGDYAYRRSDGILIVPIGCLKN